MSANRSPIRQKHAELYLLITLISFAVSVSTTRLFLELTGYPQIGGGELHIAHVLWGGVFLFTASLLPLIFANRWALQWAAVCSGIGVGLFIDEVGKFITSSNDYFFPAAAPIVYAVFLLTVVVYVRVRRVRKTDARSELYHVLSDLEEVLDHDLSEEERLDIIQQLEQVKQMSASDDLARLADELSGFVQSKDLRLITQKPPLWKRLEAWWLRLENRWFSRQRMRYILAGGLLGWGIYSVLMPISILLHSVRSPQEISSLLTNMVANRLVRNPTGLTWFEARVGVEGTLGIVLIACALLLLFGQEKRAIYLSYFVLLLSLTIVNLVIFYFDQFSTIIGAALQFVVLMGVIRYRKRFLKESL